MSIVKEKEFFTYIRNYSGKLRLLTEMNLDPPVMTYIEKESGKIIGRYKEWSLSNLKPSPEEMYYEVF